VNGISYSLETFETLLSDLVKNQQLEAGSNGLASKQDAVSVMRTLLRYETYKKYLADFGLEEDAADRSQVEEQAKTSEGFSSFPQYLQDLLINLNVAQLTIDKFTAYSASTLEKMYNESPASTGVMCLSHILLKTEDDARKVLKELDNGADFAELAGKVSIEPGASQSGGLLSGNEEPCTDLAYFQQQLDSNFMKGAIAAKAGVPSGPVKTQFGYHVVLSRPYNEIKDSLKKVAGLKPTESNLVGYLANADISINPTYGVWNGATATID